MSEQRGPRKGASPMIVFLVLLVLLGVVVGGVIWAGQTEDEPLPPAPAGSAEPEEDHSLTDAEAIARFKELDALRIRALEERDLTLIENAFTPNGPAANRVTRAVRRLRRADVTVDEIWEVKQVRVIDNLVDAIRIEVVGVSDARFFDEAGNEVTLKARRERQRVHCRLNREDSVWLLHNCTIRSANPVAAR